MGADKNPEENPMIILKNKFISFFLGFIFSLDVKKITAKIIVIAEKKRIKLVVFKFAANTVPKITSATIITTKDCIPINGTVSDKIENGLVENIKFINRYISSTLKKIVQLRYRAIMRILNNQNVIFFLYNAV